MNPPYHSGGPGVGLARAYTRVGVCEVVASRCCISACVVSRRLATLHGTRSDLVQFVIWRNDETAEPSNVRSFYLP